MNLAIKILMKADEREPIKVISRFCIKPIFSSIYFQERKHNNDNTMQINL